LIQLAHSDNPPLHFLAGEDTIKAIEEKMAKLHETIEKYRKLSTNMTFDN